MYFEMLDIFQIKVLDMFEKLRQFSEKLTKHKIIQNI